MKRKQYRVSREGRAQIVYGLVSDLQFGQTGVTMTRIARAMGLVPSTYIANILWELYRANDVTFSVVARRNGGYVRRWRVLRPGEKNND